MDKIEVEGTLLDHKEEKKILVEDFILEDFPHIAHYTNECQNPLDLVEIVPFASSSK